jgi:hypothetical protein
MVNSQDEAHHAALKEIVNVDNQQFGQGSQSPEFASCDTADEW